MHFTGSCLCCMVGLAAVFLQGVWGSDIVDRGESRRKHDKWGQNRSNTWPKLEQKVVDEDSDAENFRLYEAGQPVHGLAPTPLPTSTNAPKADVFSPQITAGPALFRRKYGSMRWDAINDGFLALAKRDAESCTTGYQLCPASLSGGCCPQNGYSCGTSSCLPVTGSPASACGFAGYIGCDLADGGGCCPPSYICAKSSCSPSPGVASLTCAAGSFQCPASLGGGCCPNGQGCKLNACYNTNPITFTFTDIITTTNAKSNTVTLTSTITSTTISGAPDPTETIGILIPKIQGSATPIAKAQPISSGSSGSGLSSGALGGIIGGAIFFLSAILIAAIFIIRGLNRASKTHQELANSGGSRSSQHRSGASGQHRPSGSEDIDTMSVDPLMMTHSPNTGSIHHRSGSGVFTPPTPLPEMEGSNSPPTFIHPFPLRSLPHTHYQGGYNPVANSDQYSQSSGGYRDASIDSSSPPTQYTPHGYFDIPIRSSHTSNPNNNRTSFISSSTRRPTHGRNYSNSSEVSQTSSLPSELDGTTSPKYRDGHGNEPRSPFHKFMRWTSRKRVSESPVALSGGPRRGSDWMPSPHSGGGMGGMGGLAGIDRNLGAGNEGGNGAGGGGMSGNGGMGLGFIPEAGESKIALDGQYQQQQQQGMVDISLMDQPPRFRMG